jgi:hypothetical protein
VVVVVVAAAAVSIAAVAVDTADTQPDLEPLATAVGEAWVHELVNTLRSEDRDVVGAWPGTMSEARMRIRVALRMRVPAVNLDDLARIAIGAARRGWHEVSVSDPEA